MFNLLEVLSIIQWWLAFFIIGLIFFPISKRVFAAFNDSGYIFSKVIGILLVSYVLLIVNIIHVLPFGTASIIFITAFFAAVNFAIYKRDSKSKKTNFKLIFFEEVLFFLGIAFWSFIRAHEPSLNGLEKFMDFGFLNSILRTDYQPAVDMWFTPLYINYYYFGHLSTAVMTKLSNLPSYISYNLMIATLFSFCFTLSFSLAINLISREVVSRRAVIAGLLSGALITLAGNLHTIYAFFKAYNVDKPVPFWDLPLLINSFPNAYWYPNATRFILFTIHEFPLYSFVVSDLHGHVIDIMYVLTLLALAYVLFIEKGINKMILILISLTLAVMYMTNVWDGLIYMLLIFFIIAQKKLHLIRFDKINLGDIKQFLTQLLKPALLVIVLFFIFSLPFNLFFKPFASGIGILCAPSFLTDIKQFGPFLFEQDHCQKSEWWELLTLYGFFYFFVASFFIFIARKKDKWKFEPGDIFVSLLIILSTILIIIPEFIYVKDIYPAHYRANTMFKLVYQAFMMLSIASGYIIYRIVTKNHELSTKNKIFRFIFAIITILLLIFVFYYPYTAVKSYYADLNSYSGLDGIAYLKTKFPEDYSAIKWINKNISARPVIVEAQGDSYTDYARISANTGLPTILGWTVHEWLWRGSYDIPSPRIQEVTDIYGSPDLRRTRDLLDKYNAEYIYVGSLERQKYPNLLESKFEQLGDIVFQEGQTKIYKLN